MLVLVIEDEMRRRDCSGSARTARSSTQSTVERRLISMVNRSSPGRAALSDNDTGI